MVKTKEPRGVKVDELVRFGEAVRAWRKARGYSQEAFGDACGIDRSYMGPDGHPNSPAYGHLKLPHLN